MPDEELRAKLPFLNSGIAQVALVVKDLDKTVENYWNLFGIGPWHFYTYGKPLLKRMTYRGKHNEYKVRIALAWIASTRIELIEMIEGDTVFADFVKEHGYGVHHFGILVDNMESSIAEAEATGFTVIQDGAGQGRNDDGHFAYLDTEDKIGFTIELIELPKDRWPPEKTFPSEDER